METRRLISVLLAAVAAILVIWAGKSCAEDIQEKNREEAKKNYTNVQNATGGNGFNVDYGDGVAVYEEPAATETTAGNVETVTNLFGDIVGTITVTTTAPPETEPIVTTTVSKSILESYNEQRQTAVTNGQGSILERPQTETTVAVTQPTGIIIDLG